MMAKTTVEFSAQAGEVLERLASSQDRSKADVLRDALSLYNYICREVNGEMGGPELAIARNDKVQKILVVPGIHYGFPAKRPSKMAIKDAD